MKSFLLGWRRTDSGCNRAARKRGKPLGRPAGWGKSFVPRLDVLEDRTLPSTLTVLNLHDSGTGSLRAAITAANAQPGDTINFANGLHGTITLTSGELLITANMTINGPGANQLSISGDKASRIFDMTTGLNVTINGLAITHGRADGSAPIMPSSGGGILNQGSNLTLSADVLSQNVVLGSSAAVFADGGGLESQGGDLTITGSTFTGNQALGGTSLLGSSDGGAIDIAGGNATISNSIFSGNQAHGSNGVTPIPGGVAQGGAISAVENSGAPLTITGSTFSGNSAVGGNGGIGESAGIALGGAIITIASLTITGSTFSGNSAVGGNGTTGGDAGFAVGGAILPYGPTSISVSEFDHNQAIGGSNGNSGPGQQASVVDIASGGAIATGSTLNVTSSSFSHNLASGGNNATATGPTSSWSDLALGVRLTPLVEIRPPFPAAPSTITRPSAARATAAAALWSWSARPWEARPIRVKAAASLGPTLSRSATAPWTATMPSVATTTPAPPVSRAWSGSGPAGALRIGWEARPSSAAASWTTARLAAAAATRPAAPELSSRGWAPEVASSTSWGITTPLPSAPSPAWSTSAAA